MNNTYIDHTIDELEEMLDEVIQERKNLYRKIRKFGSTKYDEDELKSMNKYAELVNREILRRISLTS